MREDVDSNALGCSITLSATCGGRGRRVSASRVKASVNGRFEPAGHTDGPRAHPCRHLQAHMMLQIPHVLGHALLHALGRLAGHVVTSPRLLFWWFSPSPFRPAAAMRPRVPSPRAAHCAALWALLCTVTLAYNDGDAVKVIANKVSHATARARNPLHPCGCERGQYFERNRGILLGCRSRGRAVPSCPRRRGHDPDRNGFSASAARVPSFPPSMLSPPFPLWRAQVGPYTNPSETYRYYSLPFCKPVEVTGENSVLGDALAGDRRVNTMYNVKFKGTVRGRGERAHVCVCVCVCVCACVLV